jgi:hypothetical protein
MKLVSVTVRAWGLGDPKASETSCTSS